MAQRFLTRQGGKTKQIQAAVESTGNSEAGNIIAADATGKMHPSWLPLGVGVQVDIIEASESLTAGNFVNIHESGGAAKVRKADASNGRPAHGFVAESFTASEAAEVFPLDGVNAHLTDLDPASDYWLGTAGGVTDTPLDETDDQNANKISQLLGVALSETELRTDDHDYVIL